MVENNKKKSALSKILITLLSMIAIITTLLITITFWGPDTSALEQQARQAAILLSDENIIKAYQPIPSQEQNAAPAIKQIVSEFQYWNNFFEQHQDQFQHSPENIKPNQKDNFPEPDFHIEKIIPEDIANIRFYLNNHSQQIEKLKQILDTKDRYYYPSWLNWEKNVTNILFPEIEGVTELYICMNYLLLESSLFIYENKILELVENLNYMNKISDYYFQYHFSNGARLYTDNQREVSSTIMRALFNCRLNDEQLQLLSEQVPVMKYKECIYQLITCKEFIYDINSHAEEFKWYSQLDDTFSFSKEYLDSYLTGTKLIDNISKNDYLEYLLAYKRNIPAMNMQAFMKFHEMQDRTPSKILNFRKHMVMPAQVMSVQRLIQTEAYNRFAKLAAYLEQYRLAHNCYPENLTELKAAYNDAPINDILSISNADISYVKLTIPDTQAYQMWTDFLDPLDKNNTPYKPSDNLQSEISSEYNLFLQLIKHPAR